MEKKKLRVIKSAHCKDIPRGDSAATASVEPGRRKLALVSSKSLLTLATQEALLIPLL